jgi:hypothetical protein
MSDEIYRALGRIEGQLQGVNERLDRHGDQLTGIDDRLRAAETTAAREGGKAGILTGIGVALLVESVRAWARGHSGT